MPIDRRKFFGAGATLGAGLLAIGGAAAETARPAQARTTMLGTRDQQFLLAKITVSNLVRSYRFYTEILGLKLAGPMAAPTDSDPEQEFRELPLNFSGSFADPFFVLVKRRGVTPSPEHAAHTVIGFKTPDSHAILERAAAAGYQDGRREIQAGAMSFAFVSDPDGYMLELIQAGNYASAE